MPRSSLLCLAQTAHALLLCPPFATAQEPVSGNLLANPGFEQVEGGLPASWGTFDDQARSLVALDRATVFAGEYALMVTGDPAETWQPVFSGGLKVESGGEYTLGGYVKADLAQGDDVLFSLREISAEGQSIRFSAVPVPLKTEWGFRSQKLKLTDKTTSVQVFIVLQKCEGMAWFDDLVLVKGDLPDVEALLRRTPKPAAGTVGGQTPRYHNLLENNSFEVADAATGLPVGWSFSGEAGQTGHLDSGMACAGRVSFEQSHSETGLPSSFLRPTAPAKLSPNASYRLSGWVRTSPDGHSAWIMLCPDTSTAQGKTPWIKFHPDQAYVNDLGASNVAGYSGELQVFPSMASARWLEDVNRMLTELVGHVKGAGYAGRVIGYQLSGYEWFQWEWSANRMDCSVPVRDAFRRWLRGKYVTPEKLQTVWGEAGLSFDKVQLPTTPERRQTADGVFRDPSRQRHVTDFARFYNELIADVLIGQARTIKQAAGQKTLVSCFYGYEVHMFDGLARESSGHMAMRKLLDSGMLEFMGAPTDGYLYERGLGGTGGFMTLPGSYPLHGALYVDQPDLRTHWSGQDLERTATLADVQAGVFGGAAAAAGSAARPGTTGGGPRLLREQRCAVCGRELRRVTRAHAGAEAPQPVKVALN